MTTPNVPSESPAPVSKKKKGCAILGSLAVLAGVVLCLGAIATPKFGGFDKCRPRQSEAKTNLSGLYTAEKAFFGEYGFYSTDLDRIGWWPDGSPRYVYGFATASAPGPVAGVDDYDPSWKTTLDPRVAKDRFRPENAKRLDGTAFSEADFAALAPATTASTSGFLAVAIGDVDADSDPALLDVWTIDEQKNLLPVRNDCAP